jgi:dipeptidyl aminopeptidase/acylaminoacyl peptidase
LGGALAVLLAGAAGGGVMAQDKDIFPVPDNYRVEGIPEIKKSDVEKLFFDPSEIRSNLIWDADTKNRRLLVTDATNNIYLLDSPLKAPQKLIEKIVPYRVKVRLDGSGFAYTSDHEHEDNYQLYYYDFKEKPPKKVATLTGKDESVESFAWDKSSNVLFYSRVDYATKTSKLCETNTLTERCFPVDLKGIWNVVDADANRIIVKYWKASSSQFLYIYDVKTNKLSPIDEKGNSQKGFIFGKYVFWINEGNDACDGNECILSMDLNGGRPKRLNLPSNLNGLDDAKFSPKGNNLLIQESKNGTDTLRIFRLKRDNVLRETPAFVHGSYVIWNTRWLAEDEVVYTLEDIGKPASIQSYDVRLAKRTDWTKERLPAQLKDKIRKPEILSWKSFDGKEIPGYIVRPVSPPKRSPVLIYVHGGPQILDKPAFNSQDIEFASNLGMTTIHTNIRGSSGFGREFMDSDDKGKRGDAVKDIQSLLDWIKKQPELDPSRIYLRGESYGGLVVLATALREPLRIKGVIAEYPLVSIRGYLSQSWIDEFAKSEYGDPGNETLMKQLDQLSPLNNVDRWNNIPLFLTRGANDGRSPESNVIDLKNQLQTKGSKVWFIYSSTDGHGFGGKYVTAAMFEFLKTQIKKEI